MKYCIKCKKLFNDDKDKCDNCSSVLVENIENKPITEILLIQCSGMDKDLVISTLKDNSIAHRAVPVRVEKYANEMQRDRLTAYNIYIPLSEVHKARDILNGINKESAYQNIELSFQDNTDDNIKQIKNNKLFSIIFMLISLVLVALVVFGTDFIISLIKGLF